MPQEAVSEAEPRSSSPFDPLAIPEGAEVVVYDGDCGFCQKQVRRIQRWDRAGRFWCVPRQAEGLTERFPALAEGDFESGMRLIQAGGQIRVGADAIYGIARGLPGVRWSALLYRVPGLRALARAVYGWVARNRHRLAGSCEQGACSV